MSYRDEGKMGRGGGGGEIRGGKGRERKLEEGEGGSHSSFGHQSD